ncbi:uncharacterized protein LOC115215663 [Octopus sinensis]|uniref:Uncharacterized protein LOC115215663 n=1 Tax=Octopus sinensis TaxID=2607531 RepID=A0A6P7SR61_9MOLL|nr:uncharacterized protein LOC115215663 [Octopus sinensis]
MGLSKSDIRAIVLFNFKIRCKVDETARDINEMFWEEMTSGWSPRKGFERFRCGIMSLEDRDSSGRPSVINDGQLKTLFEKVSGKATRELVKELQVSQKTVCKTVRTPCSTNGYHMIRMKIRKSANMKFVHQFFSVSRRSISRKYCNLR